MSDVRRLILDLRVSIVDVEFSIFEFRTSILDVRLSMFERGSVPFICFVIFTFLSGRVERGPNAYLFISFEDADIGIKRSCHPTWISMSDF